MTKRKNRMMWPKKTNETNIKEGRRIDSRKSKKKTFKPVAHKVNQMSVTIGRKNKSDCAKTAKS